MALFGKGKKEDKKEKERQALMDKLGLDDLNDKDVETVKMIFADLAGTGGFLGQLQTVGMRAAEMQQCNFQAALVRQNWIIIRLLNQLNSKLSG